MVDINRITDIAYLKSFGEPKYFGLGFIQLKISETHRIHVWHPAISSLVSDEEVHDHRYSFQSKLIAGKLTHQTFSFTECKNGDEEMRFVSCTPNTKAPPDRAIGMSSLTGSYEMTSGSEYYFHVGQFHRIRAIKAATLLRRNTPVVKFARVIAPIGTPEVCPFSQTIPESQLWDMIDDVLNEKSDSAFKPGYHLTPIAKGELGEISKIQEELSELEDAITQDCKIMAMVELSDLYGSIDAFLAKNYPDVSMNDLAKMSGITKRAFENGKRK